MTIPKTVRPSRSRQKRNFRKEKFRLQENGLAPRSRLFPTKHLKGLPHASLFALPDPIIRIILISTDDASLYE